MKLYQLEVYGPQGYIIFRPFEGKCKTSKTGLHKDDSERHKVPALVSR